MKTKKNNKERKIKNMQKRDKMGRFVSTKKAAKAPAKKSTKKAVKKAPAKKTATKKTSKK